MKKAELLKRKATLESIHDQLLAELSYIDTLMRHIGFSDGLRTVKATAQDIIKQNLNPQDEIQEDEVA